MTLNDLFKNTTYDDTLFSPEAKSAVSARIFMKAVRGNEVVLLDSISLTLKISILKHCLFYLNPRLFRR